MIGHFYEIYFSGWFLKKIRSVKNAPSEEKSLSSIEIVYLDLLLDEGVEDVDPVHLRLLKVVVDDQTAQASTTQDYCLHESISFLLLKESIIIYS